VLLLESTPDVDERIDYVIQVMVED